jgi:pimeloyl-ACP methyl ester carboxylesterase
MRFFLFALLCLFPVYQASANPPDECDKIPGVKWRYCVYAAKNSMRADQVIYYFHSAMSWGREWEVFQEYLKPSFGNDSPTVVTISFGDVWLLNEPNSSRTSGLLPKIVNEVIPTIEARVLKRTPTQRILVGKSMGGFNVTQLVLKHPELFARAALLCPGYITFNPHDNSQVVDAYVKRTGADSDAVAGLLDVIRGYFPSRESWEAESPLLGGATLLSEATPPLFVATGKEDPYGFYEGSTQFVKLALMRGARVEFSDHMQKHCERLDYAELGKFLTAK